jgi:hypothetical protein
MRSRGGSWTGYDDDLLKGRLAEALVEGMLMRAGHVVSRSARLRRTFVPGFMVRKPAVDQLIPMEVIFRRDLRRFMRVEASRFVPEASQWPGLCLVLVTDKPSRDHSCYQVLDLGGGLDAVQDLDKMAVLDVFPSTVREYDRLALKLFPLLGRR